jgi:hypothetical protein
MEENHEQSLTEKGLGNAQGETGGLAHTLCQISPSWEAMCSPGLSALNSPVQSQPIVPRAWSSLDAMKTSQPTWGR